MEYFPSWFVYGAIIVFSTIAIVYNRRRWRKDDLIRGQLPLGKLGWPIIGETLDYISSSQTDHPETFMLDHRRRYGKVFKSHLFGRRMIISTDPEVNRGVLQCDSDTLVPYLPKVVTELFGKYSIFFINGSLHRRLHGLIAAFVKSSHLKAKVTADLHKYIDETMSAWKDDQLIHIQYETKKIAFPVMVKALVSLDHREVTENLRSLLQEFLAGFSALPIKMPGSQFSKSLLAKKKMVKIMSKIIEAKRNNNCSESKAEDVADVLINDARDVSFKIIVDIITDLMIPGEDNLPVLVSMVILFLSNSPKALQQFTEENIKLKRTKEALGEPLCWSDYVSLPFTQCVITETLRKGNFVPGLMREAVKDVVIKGHFIPKGWCVMADFRSVHLDANQYESPHQFNPWRWQGKDVSNMSSSCSFTPFGGGQRLCPGIDLTRLKASILLHHYVTRFSWVAGEDSMVSFPTVRMRHGMPIRITRRIDP